MSKSKLYDAVKAKIDGLEPLFNWGGLFNNQFEREAVEDAHRWPVVYIEFANLDWSAGVGTATKLQQGEIEFILHLGFKTIEKDNSKLLADIDEVYKALHATATGDFDPVRRIREKQFTDWNNVFIWQITFRTALKDESAANLGSQVIFANDIIIERNLVVENPSVRSGSIDGE